MTNQQTAAAILNRLQQVFRVKSDGELSRALRVKRSTLGSWRAQDRRPYEKCVELSEATGVSLDWLLTGKGEMHRVVPGSAVLGALRDAVATSLQPPEGAGTGAAGEQTARAASSHGVGADAGAGVQDDEGTWDAEEAKRQSLTGAQSPRLAALVVLLDQLPADAREQIIQEAFARAATAQQLADLRQALARVEGECRRAS